MRSALAGVSGVQKVDVELSSATVTAVPEVTKSQLRSALEEAGYGASKIEQKKPSKQASHDREEKEGSTKEKHLPSFTVNTVEGKVISAEDLEGHVVLVDFWGTWCPPCVREAPHLQDLYEKWKQKGLVILGPAVGDSRKSVIKFRDRKRLTYPMVIESATIQELFQQEIGRFEGVPTMYLFDRNGLLRTTWTGYQKPEVLKSAVATLLGENESDQDQSSAGSSSNTNNETASHAEAKTITATFKVANMVEREDKL